MILLVFPSSSQASDKSPFTLFKSFIFDTPYERPYVRPNRPHDTQMGEIINETNIHAASVDNGQFEGCLGSLPHATMPIMEKIGNALPVITNNLSASVEEIAIQPHFSGLKGPKIKLMRKDIEATLINAQGSSHEIYHNAKIEYDDARRCDDQARYDWDIELRTQIDLGDSDKAPLTRSDIIQNNRLHFGGYFMATVSPRYRLYHNLERDDDLFILDRLDPIGQDEIAFADQSFGINNMMLSGFATPLDGLHLAAHGGFLEERFFGLGGEFLYRPYDSNFAIGGGIWGTKKRIPYLGNIFGLNDNNTQTSALLNLWYDMPDYPISFGLTGGQFTDGDAGMQFKTIYKNGDGWRVEGFATWTNEDDKTLQNDDTNIFAGMRVTMPLGQFQHLPDNSRASVYFEPFARDKGQRIENPYPLYDITDPWQTRNLYKYWERVVD
jgi:hypothetical protein